MDWHDLGKIEGRFLRATANGESARITGGSDSKVLSIDNMPSHNHELTIYENGSHTHTQSAHSHNRGNMEISGHFEGNRDGAKASGAFKHDGSWNYGSGDGGRRLELISMLRKHGQETRVLPNLQSLVQEIIHIIIDCITLEGKII